MFWNLENEHEQIYLDLAMICDIDRWPHKTSVQLSSRRKFDPDGERGLCPLPLSPPPPPPPPSSPGACEIVRLSNLQMYVLSALDSSLLDFGVIWLTTLLNRMASDLIVLLDEFGRSLK